MRLADLPPGAPLAAGTSVASVYLQRFRSFPARTRDALVLAAAIDGGEVQCLPAPRRCWGWTCPT